MISAFDLFKIGIGPSSSHTGGPMTAAYLYTELLRSEVLLESVDRLHVQLFGSLGVTGHGHGTIKAVLLGLEGEQPHLVDPITADARVDTIGESMSLNLAGQRPIRFDPKADLILHRRERLDYHTNGMRFQAYRSTGELLKSRDYFSVGGGFVLDENQIGSGTATEKPVPVPNPFTTGDQLLALCKTTGMSFSDVVLANELSWRTEEEVRAACSRSGTSCRTPSAGVPPRAASCRAG